MKMVDLDDNYRGYEDKFVGAPEEQGYRICDREDADDALQQAVLCCPNTSRELFAEAMTDLLVGWAADGQPSMPADLAVQILESALHDARKLAQKDEDSHG